MANFSVNQARQLYVADGDITVSSSSVVISTSTAADSFFFTAKNALDEKLRSDIIESAKIDSISFVAAADLKKAVKKHTITVASGIENSDEKVPAGLDCILRVSFSQYVGLSEEDTYYKYGQVYTKAATTKSDFYKELALSLRDNIKKDQKVNKLFTISLKTATSSVPVTETTTAESLTGTYTGVILGEVIEGSTSAGGVITMSAGIIPFTVSSLPVTVGGIELPWAEVTTEKDTAAIAAQKSGAYLAELEQFCAGEKGDVYRNMGWPNVVPTKYMVDPTKDYDVIDIQYHWSGDAEDVQKSPKTLTLVIDTNASAAAKTTLTTVTGKTIKAKA